MILKINGDGAYIYVDFTDNNEDFDFEVKIEYHFDSVYISFFTWLCTWDFETLLNQLDNLSDQETFKWRSMRGDFQVKCSQQYNTYFWSISCYTNLNSDFEATHSFHFTMTMNKSQFTECISDLQSICSGLGKF